MWASFAETLLKILTVLLPSLVTYQAGKNAVKSTEKDEALDDVKMAKKIDSDISIGDDDWRKRMRNKFTRKQS